MRAGILLIAGFLALGEYGDSRSGVQGSELAKAMDRWRVAGEHTAPNHIMVNRRYRSHVRDPEFPSSNQDIDYRYDEEIYILNDSVKIISIQSDSRSNWLSCRVVGSNPEYAFGAKRGVAEGAFSLTQYGTDDGARKMPKFRSADIKDLLGASHVPLPVVTFIEDFRSGTIVELSSRAVDDASGQFVEFTFSIPPTARLEKVPPSERVLKVVADKARGYRIVRTAAPCGPHLAYTSSVRYADDSYVISGVDYVMDESPREAVTKVFFTILSQENIAIAPAEFRLPSIGIAEIPSPGRRTAWRLLIVAGNLILLGLVGLYYLRKKNRRAA